MPRHASAVTTSRGKSAKATALPCGDELADAAFSCHVFQHFNDNAAQRAMFGEIARVLKPGGTFLIDLPTHQFPTGRFAAVARSGYAAYLQMQRAKAAVQRHAMRLGFRPPMRMVSYEADRLLAILPRSGSPISRSWSPRAVSSAANGSSEHLRTFVLLSTCKPLIFGRPAGVKLGQWGFGHQRKTCCRLDALVKLILALQFFS
jgi:SAM-dependent methyltransferase